MVNAPDLIKLATRIALFDDAFAYKELFRLYHQRLVQFATAITRSKELAEEAVSDVFIKIWKNRHNLPRIENLHLYLYTSTKNQAINILQQQKKHGTFSFEEVEVELLTFDMDPEEVLVSKEMLRKLQSAIQGLPSRCRLIFKLIKEDGFKHREAAELLGLSLKTVENQMTIALRKVGQSIQYRIGRPTK